jgi:regulator of protease activity HflC (stomatin/prohibitin superfamily)
MKTFENSEMRITANEKQRTFTIYKKDVNGRCYAKYRTIPQSKEDFHYYSNFATARDWNQFMHTDEYYLVNR